MMTISMSAVRGKAQDAGSHWFERGTMRFFLSRVGRAAYQHADGRVFFVSSEQFEGSDGVRARRLCTVRVQQPDGSIDTVGDFQRFGSRFEATREARRLAGGAI